MGIMVYVMAILGCGEGGGCQQARLVTAVFTSAAQCQAAVAPMLMRHTDLDYPVLRAACRKAARHEVSAMRPR